MPANLSGHFFACTEPIRNSTDHLRATLYFQRLRKKGLRNRYQNSSIQMGSYTRVASAVYSLRCRGFLGTSLREYLMHTATSQPPLIQRRPAVEARTGLSRANIYALMAKGDFPRPVRLGARAVGWHSQEVDEWITSRAPAGPASKL